MLSTLSVAICIHIEPTSHWDSLIVNKSLQAKGKDIVCPGAQGLARFLIVVFPEQAWDCNFQESQTCLPPCSQVSTAVCCHCAKHGCFRNVAQIPPLLAGVLITLGLLSTSLLFPLLQHHSFHTKAPSLALIRLTYFLHILLTMTFFFESSLLVHPFFLYLPSCPHCLDSTQKVGLPTSSLQGHPSPPHDLAPSLSSRPLCVSNLFLSCVFIVLSPPTRTQILGRQG